MPRKNYYLTLKDDLWLDVDWPGAGKTTMKYLEQMFATMKDQPTLLSVAPARVFLPLLDPARVPAPIPAPARPRPGPRQEDWFETEQIGRNLLGAHQGLQTTLLNIYNHDRELPPDVRAAINAHLTSLDHLIEVLEEHYGE